MYPVPVFTLGAPSCACECPGDFVDRGAFGVEVMAVLLSLRLLYPDFVLLNRGNHEDRSQNAYYNRQQHGCGRRVSLAFLLRIVTQASHVVPGVWSVCSSPTGALGSWRSCV